jgi:metal-responsive CopG/Arc/MetJ family transcriptional regulator
LEALLAKSKTVRKNINFPVDLIKKISEVKEDTDFSNFIREAAKEKVKNIERQKLEENLKQGYKAKAELNKKICGDFKYVNGENINES